MEPGILLGRLVELRPADGFEPSSGRPAWWVWRLEDMRLIGHCGLSRQAENTFFAGLGIWRFRATYKSGYGAEAYRLMREYAVTKLGAVKLLANDTDAERRSALEEAGFKLVSAFPPQHAKRRRGYGIRRYEWTAS